MGKSSREKGARAEIEVSKLLAEWWGRLEPGCEFRRTPSSGGWGTEHARSDLKLSGDLATTAERFPFAVEVKRREGWDWKRLRDGKPSPVWEWWRQAQTQAEEVSLHPMLWFRKSHERWRVMLPREVVDAARERKARLIQAARDQQLAEVRATAAENPPVTEEEKVGAALREFAAMVPSWSEMVERGPTITTEQGAERIMQSGSVLVGWAWENASLVGRGVGVAPVCLDVAALLGHSPTLFVGG